MSRAETGRVERRFARLSGKREICTLCADFGIGPGFKPLDAIKA
jgi:hypothetical protein